MFSVDHIILMSRSTKLFNFRNYHQSASDKEHAQYKPIAFSTVAMKLRLLRICVSSKLNNAVIFRLQLAEKPQINYFTVLRNGLHFKDSTQFAQKVDNIGC